LRPASSRRRPRFAFARQFGEVQLHVMSMYHADGHPELRVLSERLNVLAVHADLCDEHR